MGVEQSIKYLTPFDEITECLLLLQIVVLDTNDEWPQFGTIETTISVDENVIVSVRLPQATDADSEQFAVCAYTLQAAAEPPERRAAASAVSTLDVGRRTTPRHGSSAQL